MEHRPDERRATLITLFLQAAHEMVDELSARVVAAGYADIRPADSRVFENLDPAGTRLTELAERGRMTHQSMSELVAGLERRRYVERVPDPSDRRARLVRLTPRGRQVMRLAFTEIAAIEARWLCRMGPDLERELRPALQRALDARRGEQAPA